MKNLPSAIAILVVTFSIAMSLDERTALQVWFVSLACFLVLVGLAHLDAKNLVSLNISRWFPAIIFASYIAAAGVSALLLQDYFAVYTALYVAMLCVALADYAGQLTVGTHIVLLMGRNHLGRPNKAKRETQYHY